MQGLSEQEKSRYLAEKLMGWVWPLPVEGTTNLSAKEYMAQVEDSYYIKDTNGRRIILILEWLPFQNINQALGDGGKETVVGAMKEKGWQFNLTILDDEFECNFHYPEPGNPSHDIDVYAIETTPAAVICGAAYQAVKAMEKKCE